MNGDSKELTGSLEELAGVATAARDAMTEDIVGRVADSAATAMDLMDKVNRSGLGKAIPQLAQMVENGDLQRLINLARVYGSAEDALTEEMVGRLTEAVSEGLSLLDRLNRGGAGRLVEMLAKLEASGSLQRVATLLPTFVDRLDMVGGLLESMDAAAKQAEDERTEGGIVSMYRMLSDSRTQETLRFMLALGQHMHERYAKRP
jgi:uncharacterized protein YjgD (DUF1641 family)